MAKTNKKTLARKRRQYTKFARKCFGTAERPRVSVFRSAKHIYAQIINDDYDQYNIDNPPVDGERSLSGSITICSTSSLDKNLGSQMVVMWMLQSE